MLFLNSPLALDPMKLNFYHLFTVLLVSALFTGCTNAPVKPEAATMTPARQKWANEVKVIEAVLKEPLTLDWLKGVQTLPSVEPRVLYRQTKTRQWISKTQFDALSIDEKTNFSEQSFDESAYYGTFYGTPLSYALLINLVSKFGINSFKGKRVGDYGYGAVGAVRLTAAAGAQVVGVDVDSVLPALYDQTSDQGPIDDRALSGTTGTITLVNGNFPTDPKTVATMSNIDLLFAKNTLKKGFITPREGKALIDPGVPLDQYLNSFHTALAPNGIMIIYNLSQRQELGKYRGANDAGSPFTREQYAAAGFEVLAFEQDDNAQARAVAQGLGWGGPQGMGDLEGNLFAQFTALKKR
jgi:hypothetical protein